MTVFPRTNPTTPLNSDVDDLEFQVVDWYMPENDKSVRQQKDLLRKLGQNPYAMDANSDPLEYDIYMYGCTALGHSVCTKVTGFCPYFFVKLPDNWYDDQTQDKLKSNVKKLKTTLTNGLVSYYINGPGGPSAPKIEKKRYIIPRKLLPQFEYCKLVWRKDFWGFTNGRMFPFLKIRTKSLGLFQSLRRYFQDTDRAAAGFKIYEGNIEPFLRFIHERDIAPCGWVKLNAGTYDILDEGVSRCTYTVKTDNTDIHAVTYNKIAPLLIASFDIECTSSHGDFPVAKKDYKKLAQEMVALSRQKFSAITPENFVQWGLSAFDKKSKNNPSIHLVYPKDGHKSINLSKISTTLVKLAEGACELIREAASKLPNIQEVDSDDEDAAGADIPTVPRAMNRQQANQAEALLCTMLSANLPRLSGDPIIQIGTTVHRYGSDDIIYKHIVTLGSCDPIEDADVETVDTEAELLQTWKDLVQRLDPDILTGYNILGFDMSYVWNRAIEVDLIDETTQIGEFSIGLGRLCERQNLLLEQRLSSAALGDNFLYYFDLDGLVNVDMLKVMQRDQKLDSYKLDAVAQHFLGDNKNDLKPHEIFEKQKGTSADRCEIARYCLQDCALVNRLLHKLKVLENNVGMGNVCSVPLNYLFMRGQGVKIFSLVSKECKNSGYLMPMLKSFLPDKEDEEGYEGAVVLDPEEGIYLDDPITVLDYSSLYPSSMIARNLSHDCFVMDDRYGEMKEQGIEYITVTYDIYEGVGGKKRVVGQRSSRFAQLPEGKKGIIPTILQKLINQRKNTRKKIEYESLVLSDGRKLSGLVKEKEDGSLMILDIDNGNQIHVTRNLITQRQETYSSFEQAVLDALQLAYKITANSLYGQIGAKTSPIYLKDIAACTTATGREMIYIAKNFVEKQYGAKVVYGDSVLPSTPVLLRNHETGNIETLCIEQIISRIMCCTEWHPYRAFKSERAIDDDYGDSDDGSSRSQKQQAFISDYDAWTDRGWSPIMRVVRHKCKKRIYSVSTPRGSVEVTEDHSLLTDTRKLVKPGDLTYNTSLLYSFPILAEPACRGGPLPPSEQRFGSALNAQYEYVRLKALGYRVSITTEEETLEYGNISKKHLIYTLRILRLNEPLPPHKVEVNMLYGPSEWSDYVYDIETEEGVFQAGVGELIVKNTDSIFCQFPNKSEDGTQLKGKEALPVAIKSGQIASVDIKKHLPPPQSLEYEKTFYPFIIFSKKRYVGNLYEEDPNKKPKQKSMGIVLKRRDNAPIVKTIYGGIIDILLNNNDLMDSVEFTKAELQNLIEGKTPLENLIVTKTLRAEYKDATKIAHKVLADRMGERDAGNKPQSNERIPFVYIIPPPGVEVKLQGDRIEHPDYIREHNLTPDYHFYITNQIMKPVCQLYALCVEQLPGYPFPPGYWLQMDEELSHNPIYKDERKRKDRITAIKMKAVEEIIFLPYLETLQPTIPKPKKKSVEGASSSSSSGRKSTTKTMHLVLGDHPLVLCITISEKEDDGSVLTTNKKKPGAINIQPSSLTKKSRIYRGVAKLSSDTGDIWVHEQSYSKKNNNKGKCSAYLAEVAVKHIISTPDILANASANGMCFEGELLFKRSLRAAIKKSDEYRLGNINESLEADPDIGAHMEEAQLEWYLRLIQVLDKRQVAYQVTKG